MRPLALAFVTVVLAVALAGPGLAQEIEVPPALAAPTEPAPDAAWDAFVASLPAADQTSSESGTDTPLTAPSAAGVGISTPSADLRRKGVMVMAVLLFLGLLATPRTRRVVLGRLRGERAPSPEGVEVLVKGSQEVGPGQRVVALEVQGQRLLVGMSPGRMDLLHTWYEASPRLEAALAMGELHAGSDRLDHARNPSSAAHRTVSVAQEVLAARKGNEAAASLVQAWRRAEEAEADETDGAEDLPWWMEGATDGEIHRIHDAAEASPTVAMGKSGPQRDRVAAKPAAQVEDLKPTGTHSRRGAARFVLTWAAAALALPALLGADVALAEGVVGAAEAIEPALRFEVAGESGGSHALRLLATLTLLAVAPALILAMTSFTRMIVVFSLLRQAVGVQQAPPNQVLIGLALFLTWFVMGPTFEKVHEHAVEPWQAGEITEGQAVEEAMVPMREFMFRNTREKDLALFLSLDRSPRPATRADVPARVLVPAFVISELKTAFQIGFLLYIPFLVIDIVVATVLLAMGMMVLPPVVISLPFKLLLFVFVDGWNLLVGSLVQSFA